MSLHLFQLVLIAIINIRNFSPTFLRVTVPIQACSVSIQENRSLSLFSVGAWFTTDLSYVWYILFVILFM